MLSKTKQEIEAAIAALKWQVLPDCGIAGAYAIEIAVQALGSEVST